MLGQEGPCPRASGDSALPTPWFLTSAQKWEEILLLFMIRVAPGHLHSPRQELNMFAELREASDDKPQTLRRPVLKGRSSVDNVLLPAPRQELTQSTFKNTPRPALPWSRALVRAVTQGLPERASPWSGVEVEATRRGLAGEASWAGVVLWGLSLGLRQDPNSLLWAQRRGSVGRHVAAGLCGGPFSPLFLVSLVWPGVEFASRGCGTQVGQGDKETGLGPRLAFPLDAAGAGGGVGAADTLPASPWPVSCSPAPPLAPNMPVSLRTGCRAEAPLASRVTGAPSEEAGQQPLSPPSRREHQRADPGPEDGLGCPGWGRASCDRGRATLSVPRTPASQLRRQETQFFMLPLLAVGWGPQV